MRLERKQILISIGLLLLALLMAATIDVRLFGLARDLLPMFGQVVGVARNLGKGQYPIIAALVLYGICLGTAYYRSHRLSEAFRESRLRFRQTMLVISSILLSGIAVNIVKVMVARPRPKLFYSDHVYWPQWFSFHGKLNSFPSGHASTEISVILACLLVFPDFAAIWLTAGTFWLASNVFAGAHWPSDVLAGAVIGYLCFESLRRKFGFEYATPGWRQCLYRQSKALRNFLPR
jgi:membrane-associated phospholipid phosphatase